MIVIEFKCNRLYAFDNDIAGQQEGLMMRLSQVVTATTRSALWPWFLIDLVCSAIPQFSD